MSEMMISIAATARTPNVKLDADTGRMTLSGESYPEDAGKFYGPILESLTEHREQDADKALMVDVAMVYSTPPAPRRS